MGFFLLTLRATAVLGSPPPWRGPLAVRVSQRTALCLAVLKYRGDRLADHVGEKKQCGSLAKNK